MADNIVMLTLYTVSGSNMQPVTTGSYDLRTSPYASAGISGTHISNGAWKFTGIADASSYKLYDTSGGTEVTTFAGGSDSRAFYDTSLTNYLDKVSTSTQTVACRTDFTNASGIKADVLGGYTASTSLTLCGIPIVSGVLSKASFIETDTIAEKTVAGGVTIDGVLLKDNIYTGHTGRALLAETNVLIVDANRSADIAGYVYNDIQTAIDYANTQTPSSSSRWTIYIVPKKNNTGYVENLTVYQYIDFTGLGRAMINGTITYSGTWTGGVYSKFDNITVTSVTDSNLTIRGIQAKNCMFKVIKDASTPGLSLENSELTNCDFIAYLSGSTITTTGSNKIIKCNGNKSITWDSTDTVFSYDYIADQSITYL